MITQESYLNGFSALEQGASPVSVAGTGEQIDLYTGVLSFSVTDVSLPGTGDLRVAVTRSLDAGIAVDTLNATSRAFGDWRLEVPRITGIVYGDVHDSEYGWQTGEPGHEYDRCSHFGTPPLIETEYADFHGYEYSRGFTLHIPGESAQLLLGRSSANDHIPTMQIGGQTVSYPIVTNGDWVATCLPTLANGEPGEGFLVVAPDGRKFWFDLLVYRVLDALEKQVDNLRDPLAPQEATLERRLAVLYATRVEDRHGNWVEYGAVSAPPGVYRIEASDGRQIDIASDADSATVTAQSQSSEPRVWTYDKDIVTLPDPTQEWTLSQVTLPDNSKWTYDLEALSTAKIEMGGSYCSGLGPAIMPVPSNHTVGASVGALSLITPSGMHVAYDARLAKRGHSYTPIGCTAAPDPEYSTAMRASTYYLWEVESKTVTGAGLPQRQWMYDYSDPHDSWETECDPVCTDEVWTEVTDPENHDTRYTFSNRFDATESNLLKIEWGLSEGPGGSALRTEQMSYAAADAGPYPSQYGLGFNHRLNWKKRESQTPLQSRAISERGNSYAYTVNKLDNYARAAAVTRAATGAGGDSISETLVYTNKPAYWVLGTVTSRTVTAPAEHTGEVPFSQTLYANGQPHVVSRFGRTSATYGWYPVGDTANAGELKKFTDARNHATDYSDYERGIPKTIDYADANGIDLTVNDFGEVMSITDEELDTLTVQRDSMGRIRRKIFPADAGQSWNDIVISYEIVPSSEYGVSAGHWRVTRTNGNQRQITVYNAALHPVLSKETDDSGETNAGDGHMTWRQFDSAGRETFASYPLDDQDTLPGSRPGIDTKYDALGRVDKRTAASELGPLVTDTTYLSGNKISVKNPLNRLTTTTYQAFDRPSYETATKVVFADDGNTDITIDRNVYGKPESMSQSGDYTGYPARSITHAFQYDDFQQLCLQTSPETGRTGYGYYANGLLKWSVQDLSANIDPCVTNPTPPAATTVYRSYDVRDRLLAITYPGTTPDSNFTWDDDGKLDTATRGGSSWDLHWLNRGLLDDETLSIGSIDYLIDYGYNNRGQRNTLEYPSGRQISLNPDALGRPRQLGIYASNIDYDAWGAPESFDYGNGMAFAQGRNGRGLIESTTYSLGGYPLVDRTLSYDKNGNLKIIDGSSINYPADHIFSNGFEPVADLYGSFAYDVIDRLESATSSQYGSESFRYDPLGNIRSYTLNGSTTSFGYDEETTPTNRLDDVGGTVYGYDTRGNVDAIGSRDLTYNLANELILDLFDTDFAYDARGWRYHKDVDIANSDYHHNFYFVYDSQGRLIERIDNGEVTDFVYLGAMPVARIENGQTTHIHSDYQNTPIVETNASGALTRSPVYHAYGWSNYDEGFKGLDRAPGYAGSYPDLATGISYMGARYQFGPIMRFFSPDPAPLNPLSPVGLNRYAYAADNPVRYFDPNGREAACVSLGTTCGQNHSPTPKRDAAFSTAVDFIPVVGDIKGAVEAAQNPSVISISAAVVGLVPGIGDAASKGIKLLTRRVPTPHGIANQANTPAAHASFAEVQSGATVYRQGSFGVQNTTNAQFWSLQNPASSQGFARQMGMPGGTATPDWLMGGQVVPGASVITRPAPGLGRNVGGSLEAVVSPGGVRPIWFHMTD